ncbi:MAG: polysaccharide pyruvyl transferase family protein [Moorea sp. SIO3I7]|nr:polysaccharide pyruvyl transferase family protein [Moorena sp. SIO3I7]NEO04443.1 polysaccharide pyruvyl transferase family protein [Moorena sp. SIO3I8]NEQ58130.1 polysaccharide pyruvyl transferase family protein [Moorena sp. SIO4A1]
MISLSKAESKNVLLIDVTRNPKEVIADITRCEAIASSSLHGLIIADAFGIPSIWMQLSNKVSGKGFKFKDYYSVFGETPNCLTGNEIISIKQVKQNTRKRSSKIYRIKEELDLMFHNLNYLLEKHQYMMHNNFIYRYHYCKQKLD